MKDTISELYDQADKDAVFRSSMKRGGALHDFNATKFMASPPGRQSSPPREMPSAYSPGAPGQESFGATQGQGKKSPPKPKGP